MRGNAQHEKDMEIHGIKNIDLVIVNLYAFDATVAKGGDFDTCIENIDIGGPSMLRSSAKNHKAVVVSTNPSQYADLIAEMNANGGSTTIELRKRFAAAAFATSAKYDASISAWFANQLSDKSTATEVIPATVSRTYKLESPLKYGCNPQQAPAAFLSVHGSKLPFEVINGNPGYINLCDALNAWNLVKELRESTGLAAATSFKHVSPAGAGLAIPLTEVEKQAYEITGDLTPAALAYARARNADPMCSFGDFAALSEEVDLQTANMLKGVVSDGIIAPSYTPEALEILKEKKKGAFIVLKANKDVELPSIEYRELHGCVLAQKRNTVLFGKEHIEKVVSAETSIPEEAKLDLILASITLKYTQSNSVGYAKNGMMLGVGAGQQSRVDCVKLAGRKVATWWLRQHPKVLGLKFKKEVKKQDRVNARVRYIEGDITAEERLRWEPQFEEVPEPLSEDDKHAFLKTLTGVSLSSDAFFPFRDGIDHASKYGVKYVSQPGGSIADAGVTEAANEYSMVMTHSGVRLFHH